MGNNYLEVTMSTSDANYYSFADKGYGQDIMQVKNPMLVENGKQWT